jgi:hypothetical protein
MTANWPQLPGSIAADLFSELSSQTDALRPVSKDPRQIYSPVGSRVAEVTVKQLIEDVTETAVQYGFPGSSSTESRIQFDRTAAFVLTQHMDISWAEAGNRSMWSFVALVPLPHVTLWRFGTKNRERWIASDLTRHTWARLWWHATVFRDSPELLGALSESDLNQLLERRSIGGDARLTREVARAVIASNDSGVPRRFIIRDSTKRLRRWLAFLDVRSLDDSGLAAMCSLLVSETLQHARANPGAVDLGDE